MSRRIKEVDESDVVKGRHEKTVFSEFISHFWSTRVNGPERKPLALVDFFFRRWSICWFDQLSRRFFFALFAALCELQRFVFLDWALMTSEKLGSFGRSFSSNFSSPSRGGGLCGCWALQRVPFLLRARTAS